MTIIDLGPCENLLKEFYKLKEDDLIYMKQIEVNQEGMKIPKIEYDVYAKLNGKNLIKLSSQYYNDVCNIDETE